MYKVLIVVVATLAVVSAVSPASVFNSARFRSKSKVSETFSQTCKNKVTFWDTPKTNCENRYHAVSRNNWHYWVAANFVPGMVFPSLPAESGPGFYTTCDPDKAKEYATGSGFVLHITSDTLKDAKKDCITYEKMIEDNPTWDISAAAIKAGDASATKAGMPAKDKVLEWNKNWFIDQSHRAVNEKCNCIVRQEGKQYKFCPNKVASPASVKHISPYGQFPGKTGTLKGDPKVKCVDVICKNAKVADCIATAEAKVESWDWDTCKKKEVKVDQAKMEVIPEPKIEVPVEKAKLNQDEQALVKGDKLVMKKSPLSEQVTQEPSALPDCDGCKCEVLGASFYMVKSCGNHDKCRQALKDKLYVCDAGVFKKA